MTPGSVPESTPSQPSGVSETGSEFSVPETPGTADRGTDTGSTAVGIEVAARKKRIVMTFEASREQVFKAFPAIANLADKSDGATVRIRVEGSSSVGFDPSWLRNAVDEPLEEADIERIEE